MRLPVLAYHATNISGNDYATNDHVAFAADLRLIDDLGLKIVPLQWVVDQVLGRTHRDLSRCVALTCDDGPDLDFVDVDHPVHGRQRSFYNCLIDFVRERSEAAQPHLHLTAFVIASAEARGYLDRNCLGGLAWMSDAWWRDAVASPYMAIGNHSFDHNHDAIPLPGVAGMTRGSFDVVDTHERADAEIARAARLIDAHLAPVKTQLFCYPYSQVNDYLLHDYFPLHREEHGMDAAFGAGAVPVTADSDVWNLPRYICGWHWKESNDLRAILGEFA